MLNNDTMVTLTNRGQWKVVYTVPEMHLKREFNERESKQVTAAEVRALAAKSGGKALIKNHLIISNTELVNELFYDIQPEYFYTEVEVEDLLLKGTEDQLLDALDFAPDGVKDLIKGKAVELKLNDVRKRNIIFQKLGFNVTSAIAANEESETSITETKTRRAAPIGATESSQVEAPVRRTYSLKAKPIENI